MHCNFLFTLTFIVRASLGNQGNNETEFVTTTGTFTIFPLILNCFPLGACISFWNANLGASSLYSNSFNQRMQVYLEISFHLQQHMVELYSWLNISHKYDIQIHSVLPTLVLLSRYLSALGLDFVSLWADLTLCLYYNWSQQLQMYIGPWETILWHVYMKPWIQEALLFVLYCFMTELWDSQAFSIGLRVFFALYALL